MVEETPNNNEFPVTFWWECWDETKIFLKTHYKRYLPFTLISFIFFLGTFLTLLPIYFRPNDIVVTVTCLVLSFLLLFFLTIPTVLSVLDLVIVDQFMTAADKQIPSIKNSFKKYFSIWHAWVMKMFVGFIRFWNIFLKVFIAFILLFAVSVLPSIIFKISAEPHFFSQIEAIKTAFGFNNINEGFNLILGLKSYFVIELSIFYSLFYLTVLLIAIYNFFFIVFSVSNLSLPYNNKGKKMVFKTTVKENKWSFAAFFVNSFKYQFLIFVILFAGIEVGFTFLLNDSLVATACTISITGIALYLYLPYIMIQMLNISFSFTDLFINASLQISKLDYIDRYYRDGYTPSPSNKNPEVIELYSKIKTDRKTFYKILKDIQRRKNKGLSIDSNMNEINAKLSEIENAMKTIMGENNESEEVDTSYDNPDEPNKES